MDAVLALSAMASLGMSILVLAGAICRQCLALETELRQMSVDLGLIIGVSP